MPLALVSEFTIVTIMMIMMIIDITLRPVEPTGTPVGFRVPPSYSDAPLLSTFALSLDDPCALVEFPED